VVAVEDFVDLIKRLSAHVRHGCRVKVIDVVFDPFRGYFSHRDGVPWLELELRTQNEQWGRVAHDPEVQAAYQGIKVQFPYFRGQHFLDECGPRYVRPAVC